MKRSFFVLCGLGMLLWALPLCAQPDVDECDSSGVTITAVTTTTSDVDVTTDIVLGDTLVSLDLSHTFIGSIGVELESPSATTVTLHSFGGGSTIDIVLTYWDVGVTNGSEPYTCDCFMQPSGPGELADFTGESSLGLWTLSVEETFGTTGTLNEWCLLGYLVPPTYPVTDVVCDEVGTGTVEVTWTNGADYDEVQILINGILDATLPGPFLDGATGSYTTSVLATPQTAEVCVVPVTLVSGEGPSVCCLEALPAVGTAEVALTPGATIGSASPPYIGIFFFLSTIVIADLQVDVDITYPFIGGIDISLTSAAMTSLTLHNNGGADANDIDVIYWELGDPNAAPYDCSCFLQASGPGALLDVIGETITGVWVMVVSSTQADTGTVNRVAIRAYDVGPAFAVADIACSAGPTGDTVDVSWTNTTDYDEINIYVGGIFETTLVGPFTPGAAEIYTILPVAPPVTVDVCVEGVKAGTPGPQECCSRFVPVPADAQACDDTDVAIPTGTTTVSNTVVEVLAIDEVEVSVVLTSDWLPNFDIFIDSPAGTQVQLHDNGGPAAVLTTMSVIFDEDGVTNGTGGYDCACAMQPAGIGTLFDFEGEISDGAWDLTLTAPSFAGGTLNDWCIRIFGCEILPPSDLTCDSTGSDVALIWTNNDTYDAIDVERDGEIVATLSGSATTYTDGGLADGRYVYRIAAGSTAFGCSSRSQRCRAAVGFTEVCDQDNDIVAGSPGGVLTISVVDSFIVDTVEVLLDAQVAFTSDWDFFIGSPYGTVVQLHNNTGGMGAFQLVWSDAGAPNTGVVGSYDCDFCSIVPSGPGTLSDFGGELTDGDWDLSTGPFSTTGTIAEWCVGLYPGCVVYPPTGLACDPGDDVLITWSNNETYSSLDVIRDGAIVATLAGGATSYLDVAPPAGFLTYRIGATTVAAGCTSLSPPCESASGFSFVCGEDITFAVGSPGATDTVTFIDPLIVGDVEVLLQASVGFLGDWEFFITSPFGTEVQLHDNGGSSDISFDLIWSDSGAVNTGAIGLYDCDLCKIQPSGPGEMADFFGEIADGDWTLSTGVFSNSASIDRWCLAIYQGCEVGPPSEVTCASDGNDIDLTWTNNDTYSSIEITRNGVTIASGLAGTTTSYTDNSVAGGLYTYRVFGVSTALGCSSGSPLCENEHQRTETCDATAVTLTFGGTTTATLTVPDPVQILEAEIYVDITFPFQTGLDITVLSPAGTEVMVADGTSSTSADLDVIFSGFGEPPTFTTDLSCGGCRIAPTGPGTLGDFEGESADGDWELSITDTFFSAGTLNEWCVGIFEGCGALPPTEVTCVDDSTEVDLTWSNAQTYSSITVTRNDATIATLAGSATSYTDTSVVPGNYRYRVLGFDAGLDCSSRSQECEVGFGLVQACGGPSEPFGGLAGEPESISETIDVLEDVEISDLLVYTDFSHIFIGDMIVSVTSPGGSTVTLHSNGGGSEDGLIITWSDAGAAYGGESFQCDCQMQPSGPGQMSDFAGQSTLGIWTLDAEDTFPTSGGGPLDEWCVEIFPVGLPPVDEPSFLRGDASGNGLFNALLDALYVLNYQFNAGPVPPCFRAADADGNNLFNALLDALYILNFQFNAGPALPAPGTTTCGLDPDGGSEPFSCDTPDPICN